LVHFSVFLAVFLKKMNLDNGMRFHPASPFIFFLAYSSKFDQLLKSLM